MEISPTTLAGFPTAIEFSGISLVTILPAPIIVLFPMITPGKIVEFAPTKTFFDSLVLLRILDLDPIRVNDPIFTLCAKIVE